MGEGVAFRSLLRAVVGAASLSAAGCAHLLTEYSLAPQPSAGAIVRSEAPSAVYVFHVLLAGGASSIAWGSGDTSVRVRSRPLSTKSWSFGPVLPVLPVFSTSSGREVEIDVSAVAAARRIRAHLPDFSLRLPDRDSPLTPTAARVPASATGELRAASGDVVLDGGGSLRLIYAVDPDEVQTADLAVRFSSDDGAWESAHTVHFARASATFVMTIP